MENKIVFELLSLICIAYLLVGLGYVACRLLFPNLWKRAVGSKREKRIAYLRTFRRGQCALVFLPVLVLYIIGSIYEGEALLDVILNSLARAFSVVVLMFDTKSIGKLIGASCVYKTAVYFCFYMVAANACVFGISMFMQRFSFMARTYKRDRLLSLAT